MTPDIGRVGIWVGLLDFQPHPTVLDAARHIESLGFSSMWIPEAVGRDPFVLASTILGATERLTVATGIANIYARDAMAMVSAQQALCEIFPNRFLLGLGVSHAPMVEGMRGHNYDKPLAFMRDCLAAMAKALYVAPRTEAPAVVIGALADGMLRLSASAANGSHPYFVPVEHTAHAREVMGPDALLLPEQMVVFETDPGKARAIARGAMGIYLTLPNYTNNLRRFGFDDSDLADGGSDRLVDAIVAWGSEDQIVARINAHLDAGADHVAVQVVRADREVPRAEWAALASALL
ncbi:MAG: TIGR03620 family F420-dependent LLM class oxidoreductase [Acidimicrobiia bacterium]